MKNVGLPLALGLKREYLKQKVTGSRFEGHFMLEAA